MTCKITANLCRYFDHQLLIDVLHVVSRMLMKTLNQTIKKIHVHQHIYGEYLSRFDLEKKVSLCVVHVCHLWSEMKVCV